MVSNKTSPAIGSKIIHLLACDSTNEYAHSYLDKRKLINGTVLYTYDQTKGKGQRGRTWYAEKNKNISLTLVLDSELLSVESMFLINKAMSLAVSKLVKSIVNKKVEIKWPNDIMVDDRKIAGLLIQNTLSGKTFKSMIIGIGINVNNRSFPDSVPNAVSLAMCAKRSFNLDDILESLLEYLKKHYKHLVDKKYDLINKTYRELLFKRNTGSIFKLKDGSEISGIIVDVNESGQLGIMVDDKIFYFNHGEINLTE